MSRKITKIPSKRGGKRPGTGGARPGSGRPKLSTPEERSAIERARATLRSALPEIAESMKQIALDPARPDAVRMRAAEFCANRAGLPPEQKVTGDGEGRAMLAIVASLGRPLPSDDDPDDVAPGP